MATFGKVCALVGAVLVVGLLLVYSVAVGAHDNTLRKKNAVFAKQDDNVQILGSIQTILKERAGVTLTGFDKYAELQKALAKARFDKGGSFAKWVTENSGDAEMAMANFADLSRSIEAQFALLRDNQSELLQLDKDYDDYRGKFMTNLVLGMFWGDKFPAELEITVVSTDQARQDFESGTLSDLNLMDRGEPTPAEVKTDSEVEAVQ